MSQAARAVMIENGERYFADPRAHYRAWILMLSEEEPSTRELFELGLIKRHGAGRTGKYLFTSDGHGWLIDNRKMEDAVDDDFEKLAYPDTFTIGGVQYKGRRDVKKSVVRIPCAEPPKLTGGRYV
jgi:hypothetical protein